EPLGHKRLIETLRHRLSQLALPGAAEGLVIELIGLTGETARQERLSGALSELRARRMRPLIEAIGQLKQRYGDSPIYRVVEVEPWSRIPERRHALMAYDP
ncbi:MAG: DNA polymerase, partial [Chloroflexota bacterium]